MSEKIVDCKHCYIPVELKKQSNGKWNVFEVGTTDFHSCKEYNPNRKVDAKKKGRIPFIAATIKVDGVGGGRGGMRRVSGAVGTRL